uniref:Uncharacterized protein n=1 Tax=Syphacia muris TaxID=451379 RepID=A0A0N5B0W3_9BILA
MSNGYVINDDESCLASERYNAHSEQRQLIFRSGIIQDTGKRKNYGTVCENGRMWQQQMDSISAEETGVEEKEGRLEKRKWRKEGIGGLLRLTESNNDLLGDPFGRTLFKVTF